MGIVNKEMLNENIVSFNAVIRSSYSSAKKHIHDGMSVIKDEFNGLRTKAEEYFHIIAQPVNNFLKDLNQIEEELRTECSKESLQFSAKPCMGNIIPIDQAILGCMEENY